MSKKESAEAKRPDTTRQDIADMRLQAQRLQEKNDRLRAALTQAKKEIEAIKEEVAKLKAPPLPYGSAKLGRTGGSSWLGQRSAST